MATRTRIQSHVARPAAGKAQLFRRVAHGVGFEYFMKGPELG
jgi:hypothetical protein